MKKRITLNGKELQLLSYRLLNEKQNKWKITCGLPEEPNMGLTSEVTFTLKNSKEMKPEDFEKAADIFLRSRLRTVK